ncbi:hypothetical protein BC834DRAFT_529900 [Gloeopeniophorella convolvens]|nr:hypothetical protein BC834DRAFT_529900 [Gloeopeniophorella convolvens]
MKIRLVSIFSCLLLMTTAAGARPPSVSPPGDNGETKWQSSQAVYQAPSVLGGSGSYLDWESPPHPNSTDNFLFSSVSGLLQRWPNTLRRNGHSIVPATIPAGTILYHGRTNGQVPSVPEWYAFDFEHAHLFCRGPCFVVTLQATRDLRLVYFDGSSAAKMPDGPLDSQGVVAWGEVLPGKYSSDRERIVALCDWGKQYDLDGFVRMEFHFEVMLCDVLDGMEVATLLELLPVNMTLPRRRRRPRDPDEDTQKPMHFQRPPGAPWPQPPKPPPGWRGSLFSDRAGAFEVNLAGSWHDRAPGETRVHLDYTGLVTFYDPALQSLVDARYGKDRIHQRLLGISQHDVRRVQAELRAVLTRGEEPRAGVDWASIVRIVTERYADRLEYLRYILSPEAAYVDTLEQAAAARAQLLVMLAPYITTADMPPQLPASGNTSWAAPVVHRCATTQTSRLPLGLLTPQEARIHAGVEGTLREICRRLMLVWMEMFDIEEAEEVRAAKAVSVGRTHMNELMNWLDWSVWVRCEGGCGLGVRSSSLPISPAPSLTDVIGSLLYPNVAFWGERGSI